MQAVFGFAAALFVFRHARSFFQKQAQLFRLAFNDAADRALTNDGVGAWAQARTQKYILHIAATHYLLIDVVAAGAIAREHAFDRDFRKLVPLTTSAMFIIFKYQLDAGAAGGLARGGAVKNHILHRLATQLRRARLTQNPTHRIHDVGFAATVRPNHTHQLTGQVKSRRLREGLKA